MTSIVSSSIWSASNGVWTLLGCPSGYVLSAQQCQLCPAAFYCTGGSVPSTPCDSGNFALPGASNKTLCFPAVFVIVAINLPISRPGFRDDIMKDFQSALAFSADIDPSYVTVDVVQSGDDAATTTVTSKLAVSDAKAAAALSQFLESTTSSSISARFLARGFKHAIVLSVKVTACLSGQELLYQSQTCQACPVKYFCHGGIAVRQSCPAGTYSLSGSNSSNDCIAAVFLTISVNIPMAESNFSSDIQLKLCKAVSSLSGISLSRINIVGFNAGRKITSTLVLVNLEIAAEDYSSAAVISSKVDQTTLNQYLLNEGLPQSLLVSITITNAQSQVESKGVSLAVVVGSAACGFVFLLVVTGAGYYVAALVMKQKAQRAFVEAWKKAKDGDVATSVHLPRALQKHHIAERVLGKGAYGCVIQARKKGSKEAVAIKIILPEKNIFNEKEMRALKREMSVLLLFTSKKCEHAVQLAGVGSVKVETDICWFIMELLVGKNMDVVIHSGDSDLVDIVKPSPANTTGGGSPIEDVECIKVARSVLAALKVIHADGVIHRDVKPANIIRCTSGTASSSLDGRNSYMYKLIDFGTALGIDDTVAAENMMTMNTNRAMGAGTQPYMSPEMYKDPENAAYPADLWSLGVSMFEMVTACLPFSAESDLVWSTAIAGDMEESAPDVLDLLSEGRKSKFDNGLSKVICKALEKYVSNRYASADEMHEAVYCCLIERGEACYSAFISYRVASDAPLARLLFDELNHSVTPGGHRVTVFWDAHRLVKGEDWEHGFATGLLNSLCFLPILSYGSTAPMATLPKEYVLEAVEHGWEETPVGRIRLQGTESDAEDNVLKELIIAGALLDENSCDSTPSGLKNTRGLLQIAYPILVGRQQPPGHQDYPRMGSFFDVQGGGGRFPSCPSPPTARAVAQFLRDNGVMDRLAVEHAEQQSVNDVVSRMRRLQGCELWNHSLDLPGIPLTKEQMELIGKGCSGPPVGIGGVCLNSVQVA